ncbi:CsxC family protein [Halobacillus litoralis]|uniref:CsxC family protein n=1 Tax=Halobacillus litoralis TaxID=45668 RepID=UPI001CD69D08|nr:hypothetical protein [Halobacillus litoralis]MCA1022050.1 hypothetical protein [Halobacillus litoralis]
MRKNTGCGKGHKKCPDLPASDKAKSKSLYTESASFGGGEEQTVVLGDVIIQSLTEADFHLPTPARAIKNIEKNMTLTQCKAIPVVGRRDRVKLFVEGVIHKNIQYVEDAFGYVRDYSIDIPFKAYDLVNLQEDIDYPFGFEYSVKENVLQYRELSDDGMGADRCEFGSVTFEINNEPIHCKLLAHAVNQLDLVSDFDKWGRFNKVTEKMDIVLVIKLTQKQQPDFPDTLPSPDDDGDTQAAALPQSAFNQFRNYLGR